jgi:hypothetical protein
LETVEIRSFATTLQLGILSFIQIHIIAEFEFEQEFDLERGTETCRHFNRRTVHTTESSGGVCGL